MTTHFSNGVTNVRGKDGDTSLFSGIKQPLITGGYGQEVAYQNDWVIYNSGDWDVTSGGGSDYQLVDYAGGWLRLGDDAPAAGEITGISGKEIWNYNSAKQWWYETRIAVTDVTEMNWFVGFADNVGDAMTFKILVTEGKPQILHRSVVRSARDPKRVDFGPIVNADLDKLDSSHLYDKPAGIHCEDITHLPIPIASRTRQQQATDTKVPTSTSPIANTC